jgi:hypothetical protein
MRLRASVGEVSDALEKVFGRFRANNQTISGVYGGVVEGHGKLGKQSRPTSSSLLKKMVVVHGS